MKGIILAGGQGTRLYPLTQVISKQLLPVYDKPMIYYPLSVLMLAGIRDILIITRPEDEASYKSLLGDGSRFGVFFTYEKQAHPDGLAQAFLIGEDFIGKSKVCLILGDNIFYGQGLTDMLSQASKRELGATIFGNEVTNPKSFGVVEYDSNYQVISIEEKPKNPKSKMAVTGLYFYDNSVIERAKSIKKSERGELEITCLNQSFLEDRQLFLKPLGRGFAWLDTGTVKNLLKASQFVEVLESRQGYKIACLEEIALNSGWVDIDHDISYLDGRGNSSYARYVYSIFNKENRSK